MPVSPISRRGDARLRSVLGVSGLALAAALLAAPAQAAAPTPEAESCRALATAPLAAELGEPDLKIELARFNPAFGLTENTEIPANCEIVARVRERTGVDGSKYAIRFHLRMPTAWNGRFFFQGGGGSNGVLGDALGNPLGRGVLPAVSLGYAVISTDAGHDNTVNNVFERQGTLSFGFDPQARADYAYAAEALTTKLGKAIVERRYGAKIQYAYFVGCSKGGQEGMAMTQRYPDLYDGVLAGAPAFRLPKAAVAQAFNVQQFGGLALRARQTGPDGRPDLYRAFSDRELALASFAVLTACDGLDGADDGWIGSTSACTTQRVEPELRKLTCKDGDTLGNCLSADQIDTLLRVQAGARDKQGRQIYAAHPWHASFGDQHPGWRQWHLGTGSGDTPLPSDITLGGGSLSAVFTTPAKPMQDTPEAFTDYMMNVDVGEALQATTATDETFKESAWSMLSADSTDRRAFRQRGGKLILFHGTADPVFSILDTAQWVDAVDRAEGGKAADFVRLYAVPGMGHCVGGLSLDRFDAFGALVNWVEKGQAPADLPAGPGRDSPWQGKSRPLCAYPLEARYRGQDDVDKAESWACERPG